MDIIDAILSCRSDGHVMTTKRFAHLKFAIAKTDFTIRLYFADVIDRSVLQGSQLLRKRSGAGLVAARRHAHAQRFMRPLVIVAMAPMIKAPLDAWKVAKGALRQQLKFKRAMKALILALGLGMIRSRVSDRDPQPQQPNRQWRVLVLAIISPRRTIVHQHPLGQPITSKNSGQLVFY